MLASIQELDLVDLEASSLQVGGVSVRDGDGDALAGARAQVDVVGRLLRQSGASAGADARGEEGAVLVNGDLLREVIRGIERHANSI